MNSQTTTAVNGAPTLSHLALPSLEISNFRAFRQLRIERFGQVNLIVGKNNVGKSCLLEAIRLYMESGSARCLLQIMEDRDELFGLRTYRGYRRSSEDAGSEAYMLSSIKNLFHGRKNDYDEQQPITIGPIDQPAVAVTVRTSWFAQVVDEDGVQRLKRVQRGSGQQALFDELEGELDAAVPGITVQIGSTIEQSLPLQRLFDRPMYRPVFPPKPRLVFVPANGIEMAQISQMWDNITLTRLEQDVLRSIQIISPRVEGLNIIGDPERTRERIAIVKVSDFEDPVPLRSMGEGMNRLFGIALALVTAQNGVLLVDEIESGLHYSVQLEMWKLVFAVAHRLNVQIFATTHSWDCIAAFQQAAAESTGEDGMLIRLQRRGDDIVVTLFDEEKLAVATQEQIEVR